jgi:hypothetical protein
MTQEQLRMQMLAGIITEGQYKAKLNEANEDLIILKNLTDKRHNELHKWMTNNLKTEPYNFGLLSVNTGNDNDFGLQIKKFKQEDVSVLMKYLEDNRYLEDNEDYDEPLTVKTQDQNIPFPTWYNSFIEALAVKLSERITGLDTSDLRFEMVDPHLMGLYGDIFNQGGLNFFPTSVRSVLKQPEFAGKAMMVWDNTGDIEDRLVARHPELKDFIYGDDYFWVYIK